jgi:tetratricopeptide (TPR) repeat protein
MGIKNHWEKYYNALKKQDWSKALSALSKIKEQRPRDPQVHLKIADLLQRMKYTESAIDSYHKAAVYLVKDGFLQKAIAIFKIILRLEPGNREATMKLEKVLETATSAKVGLSKLAPATMPGISAPVEPPAVSEPPAPVQEPEKTVEPPQPAEAPEPGAPPLGEVPSYGELPLSQETPEAKETEAPSYGEITPTVPEEETPEEPEESRELGPGYGEITLEDKEFALESEAPEKPSEPAPEFGDITLDTPTVPEEETPEEPEEPRELGPGYGEITLEDKEFALESEAPEKPSEPAPEFGDITLDTPTVPVEETTIPDQVKALSERDEGFEDFDELLAEATQELSKIEVKTYEQSTAYPSCFLPLGIEEAMKFVGKGLPRNYKRGERIINEGDTGDSLYFIRQGTSKVVAHIIGVELVLATLGEGDIFGEVNFLTGRPRTASVIADSDSEIIEFTRSTLEEAIAKNPEVLDHLNDIYLSRVSDTLKKVKGE